MAILNYEFYGEYLVEYLEKSKDGDWKGLFLRFRGSLLIT